MNFGFQWHLTDLCNMRCAHCYQDNFTAASGLSKENIYEIADRIFNGLGDSLVSVNLTGGEPFFVPYIFDLISHLHQFGNLEEINIITNGTVVNDEIAGRIASFTKIGVIKISLESGDEIVNDRIRGKGNFRKVSAGIEKFLTLSRKPVVLMMTLAKFNLDSIENMVGFARSTGVSGVIFERFVPLGSGRAITGEMLDGKGWRRAVESIIEVSGLDVEFAEMLPYRAFWMWTDGRKENVLDGAFCNLGETSMAVMPDGAVFPCRRLPVNLGNVLKEPFSGIIEKLKRYDVRTIKKKITGGRCSRCEFEDCAGCRAVAYALTGDLFAEDPQCDIPA